MFGRKNEEKVYQLMLNTFEESKNNNAMIVSVLNQIAKQNNQNMPAETPAKENMEPDKAAYALNLCTVSVSQIIDYEDLVVLEQEYDAILNNLNLENIPKDEALLKILKEILDTVSFFRIQAGERKMLEKEHQQKMKNAIWSAVPSFGLLVTGGNIWSTLISVASQVGIGYMNYRKAKAAITLEQERQMWQLQRSAIEQLNGLRRELFDTSWRLAEKYNFEDEKRLTERQISQYNEILMDSDDLRRYERLESVSKYFKAYPPFWYNLGHAANMVYQKAVKSNEDEVALRFKNIAKESFEKYRKSNCFGLLREDRINSSCALEYIDLLDVGSDNNKIKELLDSAVETSGRDCDVLQLCVLVYLRLGETEQAKELLKYLVNEGYNAVTNAQLLSYIYVQEYVSTHKESLLTDHRLLALRINPELIFPMADYNEDMDEMTADFIMKQKMYLLRELEFLYERMVLRFSTRFNKCIPAPIEGKVYSEEFYSDDPEKRTERYNQYLNQFNREVDKENIAESFANANIFLEWLNLFNELLNNIEELMDKFIDQPACVERAMQKMSGIIEKKFESNKENISTLQEKMNSKTFDVSHLEKLMNLSFDYFTRNVFDVLAKETFYTIRHFDAMAKIANTEISIKDYCKKNNYPDPELFLDYRRRQAEIETEKIYLSSELLGGAAFEKAEESKLIKEMAKSISGKIQQAIMESKENVYPVLKFGIGKEKFTNLFKEKKYYRDYRSFIVGGLFEKSKARNELVFTTKGLMYITSGAFWARKPAIVEYDKIKIEDNALDINGNKYKNKSLNLKVVFDIIQDLNLICKTQKKSSSDNDFYELDSYDVPLLDMLDINNISVAHPFELEITGRNFSSADSIEVEGNLVTGNIIPSHNKVCIFRDSIMIGEAEVLACERNAMENNVVVTLCVADDEDDELEILVGDHITNV